jgi:hypothetical protein
MMHYVEERRTDDRPRCEETRSKNHWEDETIRRELPQIRPDVSRSPARALAPSVRIRQRGASVTQSGRARTDSWVLEFEPRCTPQIDFLMGWTGSRDTLHHIQLRFRNESDAVAFAEKEGFRYVVEKASKRRMRPKSYQAKFRHDGSLS